MSGPRETWLLSYPKCGRTWLRLLLGRALQQHFGLPAGADLLEPGAFAAAHPDRPELPRIRITHDDKPQWKRPEAIEADKSPYRTRRVILLVRDPRDVVVSNYYQKARRRRAYAGTLAQFIDEPIGGLGGIIRFYNVWAANRRVPADLLLARYEALHTDGAHELGRVLDFLGLGAVPAAVRAEALRFAAFPRMRAMEERGRFGSPRLRPADRRDPSSYKTRRGVVGGFVDELDPAQCRAVTARLRRELDPWYGYPAEAAP